MVNSIADSVDDVGVVLADDVANGIHGLLLGRVDAIEHVFFAHGFPLVLAQLMVGQ